MKAAARREPLGGLPCDTGDELEVPVVVKQRHVVHLGDRGDQEIDRCGAAVLGGGGEPALRA